jgi:drug/metabolite transporter (DMT)-like permease
MRAPARSRELVLLFTLALMWGSSFLFTKVSLRTYPPLTLVTLRMGGSLAVLLAILFASGRRLTAPRGVWLAFGVMSVFSGVLPYFLTAWGQQHVDSGLAAILMSSAPLFTLLLAHVSTTDERITPAGLVGIALGLGGVALLIGPDVLAGMGDHVRGQLAIVGAVSCYAVALVFGRRLREVPVTLSAAGMQVWSTALLVPLQLALEPPWWRIPVDAPALAALGALAVLCTALPYLVYYRLLALAGAARTAFVNYLIPVVGVLWGAALLDERLPWRAAPALLLILAGVSVVNGQFAPLLRRLRGEAPA